MAPNQRSLLLTAVGMYLVRFAVMRRSLLYLCHPDIAAELGQIDEHLVPGDAKI